MLLTLSVEFAGSFLIKMRRCQRTDHCDVDCKSPSVAPILKRNITRMTFTIVGRSQQPKFLHLRTQETNLGQLEDPVAQPVVPRNSILSLLAAQGVVAKG